MLQVERVVAQMVQGSEKISYIDLSSKSQANHCVSPGLCSNFVFAIRTRAVGKKMIIETFLSTYFLFFKRMKKRKLLVLPKIEHY